MQVDLLFIGEARAIKDENRLKSGVGFGLAFDGELWGIGQWILRRSRSRTRRWGRVLRTRLTDRRRRGNSGGRRDRGDGGSQGCAPRKFAARQPWLGFDGRGVRGGRWLGLVGHRILSGMRTARGGAGGEMHGA